MKLVECFVNMCMSCIVFNGVWNFIQDNFTNKSQTLSMQFNWHCWVKLNTLPKMFG